MLFAIMLYNKYYDYAIPLLMILLFAPYIDVNNFKGTDNSNVVK